MKISLYSKLLVMLGIVCSAHASVFTDWTEFAANPVYAPFPTASLPDDYYPSVLFDAKKFDGNGDAVYYKMYHQGDTGIALSYSDDGISWALLGVVVVDANALHPTVIYDKGGFGGGQYHYKMWYWTGNASFTTPVLAIMFSQSVDGIVWTTPVATTQDPVDFLADNTQPGQPFYQFNGFGTVLYNPNATSTPGLPYSFSYVAFFDAVAAHIAPQTTQEAVGLAYSNDGLNWTRFGTAPVLIPSGNVADWDGLYNYRASVIKLNNMYHMFYSGSNDEITPLGYAHGIGHASSADGINWTKDADNPIFSIFDLNATWRSGRTLAPSVVVNWFCCGDPCSTPLLQMWFSGGMNNGTTFATAAIGYATLTAFPFPPSHFNGVVCCDVTGTIRILEAHFAPSTSGNVVLYRIYHNGTIIAEIPAAGPYVFVHELAANESVKGFKIVAVTEDGVESCKIKLHVNSCCN